MGEPWIDLARAGIEWGEGESAVELASAGPAADGVIHLPPIRADLEVRRRRPVAAPGVEVEGAAQEDGGDDEGGGLGDSDGGPAAQSPNDSESDS